MGPLSGVKIVELAGIGPGPFAGMLLSDMGADIVRIDRAGQVPQLQVTVDRQRAARYGQILLAGGITPENVAEAIRVAQPFGVDVCSGVEVKPGQKDPARVRALIETVRAIERSM